MPILKYFTMKELKSQIKLDILKFLDGNLDIMKINHLFYFLFFIIGKIF